MNSDFITNYCIIRFRYILNTVESKKPIALYGAGKHTIFLNRILPVDIKNRIAFYIDDSREKKKIYDKLVFQLRDAPLSSVGAVVISSARYQEEMFLKASKTFDGQIEKLYLGLPMDDVICSQDSSVDTGKRHSHLPDFLFDSMPASDINWQTPFDIMRIAQIQAALDSARFVTEKMADFHYSVNKEDVVKYALSEVTIAGLFLEFGVFRGKSINLISSLTNATVYGFDSFEGLPDSWGFIMDRGTFSTGGIPPMELNDNVEIVKGWFSETLPVFLEEHQNPCAFIHVDCDIYQSAITILRLLHDRIVRGTIIVFDDYFNYVGWEKHVHKAFMEYVDDYGVKYEYTTFASSHCSVAVRIL